MENAIDELLNTTFDNKKIRNIGDDNIFSILSIENKEVFHCRFLKYLIQNNWDSFVEKVIKRTDIGDLEYCQCEYPCAAIENCPQSKRGRMDLYFEAENCIVAVEVKWYAGEQPLQLLRYHQYLKRENKKKWLLIFLTLDGHAAYNVTCCNADCKDCSKILENKHYICRSFKDISQWIKNDLTERTGVNKNLLEQYNDVLEEETDRMKTENEIINKIDTKEKYMAADAIAKSMDAVKNKIREEFFKALKEKINEKIQSEGLSYTLIEILKKGKNKADIYGQDIEFKDASAQYWLMLEEGTMFRFGYGTNLYCGIGNTDGDWVYITPEWFKTQNSSEKISVMNKRYDGKKIDARNMGLNGDQDKNAIVAWYFDKGNKDREIENVVFNMLRYFGIIE